MKKQNLDCPQEKKHGLNWQEYQLLEFFPEKKIKKKFKIRKLFQHENFYRKCENNFSPLGLSRVTRMETLVTFTVEVFMILKKHDTLSPINIFPKPEGMVRSGETPNGRIFSFDNAALIASVSSNNIGFFTKKFGLGNLTNLNAKLSLTGATFDFL